MTKILLADDSLTIQKVVELTFMDVPNLDLALHGNGASACDILDEFHPDIVIADVHMPGRSGFEVAAYSKALLPEVPVLILVGAFEPFDEGAFERSGADAALEKPFDSHELLGLVLGLLQGERLDNPFRFSTRRILSEPGKRAPVRARTPALKIFLCHASQDKPLVRDLAERLRQSSFDPWLDEEMLLPGQQWELEVTRALREANAVLVCLSSHSVTKAGYVQKEIAFALDLLAQQPEGSIFLIPLQLENCDIPQRLAHLQAGKLFHDTGYDRLVTALNERAKAIGVAR